MYGVATISPKQHGDGDAGRRELRGSADLERSVRRIDDEAARLQHLLKVTTGHRRVVVDADGVVPRCRRRGAHTVAIAEDSLQQPLPALRVDPLNGGVVDVRFGAHARPAARRRNRTR